MLEYCDSFKIYVTHKDVAHFPTTEAQSQESLLTRWNGIGPSNHCYVEPARGLNGGPALRIDWAETISKTFSHQTTYTIGMRIGGSSGGRPNVYFYNNGQPLATLSTNLDGSVYVYGNNLTGTVIAQSAPGVITGDTNRYYLEFTATISGTTNMTVATEVWINSTSVCSGTMLIGRNANTLTNKLASFNRVVLGASSVESFTGNVYISDLYLTNGSGTTNLGKLAGLQPPYLVVGALFPRLDGTTLQWTPDSGTDHFSRVKENPYDGDGSFISTSTPNSVDTVYFQDPSANVLSILGLQLSWIAQSTDEGTKTFQGVIGDTGTEDHTVTFGLCSDYSYRHQAFDLNPATALPWAVDDFDTKQFGVKLVG